MLDPYAKITELSAGMQLKLCKSLELRAADKEMREIIDSYLSQVRWFKGIRILEVGCGTGAITRILADQEGVLEVIGIDPSDIFVEKAKTLTNDPKVCYKIGDGKSLPFKENVFDVVVFHTVLCHVPSPELFLQEASRVLKKGGQLVIFDGDYSLRSVSIGEHDPLQSCIEMMKKYNCHDPWLVRRLPLLISKTGFKNVALRSHGYLATDPSYMINYLERGADLLAEFGQISQRSAESLKQEAYQRVKDGRFYGFIPFLSFIAKLT